MAVTRFSALGDVAMTVPAVYDACRANPDMHFVYVTRPAFSAIFVNAPANLEVRGIDLKGEYSGPGGMIRLARSIKADVLVDLHDVLRTRLLRTLMRLRRTRVSVLDKCRRQRRRLVRHGAGSGIVIPPTVDRYRRVFEHAGIACTPSFGGLYAENVADTALFSPVSAAKAAGETWIGVAPFAAHSGKIYTPEQMLRAVTTLAQMPATRIFLFGGGKSETDTLTRWAHTAGGDIRVVAGSGIGFGGELALMSQLDTMVCMDSGNMHLAAIAGAPTVSIWGATHPAAGFAPWTAEGKHSARLGAGMPCRPCSVFGNRPCRYADMRCMRAIQPDDIVSAVQNILNNKH